MSCQVLLETKGPPSIGGPFVFSFCVMRAERYRIVNSVAIPCATCGRPSCASGQKQMKA